MDTAYEILYYANWFFIAVASFGSIFQFIYIFFVWMRPKTFKPTEKKNKVGIIISARDEESVIGSTVRDILGFQRYPKEMFDVYVVADNCTDKTAEVAAKAGARVFVHNDPDPKHHRVAYALRFGFEKIFETRRGYYDFFIRFDADNHAKEDFIDKMNDAFNAGVEIARPFEASINPTQNTWATVSATYYLRDSRIASNFRENAHLDSMCPGNGMMISAKILEKTGWDAMGMSEDAEFTIDRLIEGKRIHYVSEAVVFEDQPSTRKDTWNRLVRMGHGLHSLFWKKGFRMLGHFFVSGRFSCVDLFAQILFIPVDIIAFLWFAPYYVFFIVSHILNGFGSARILSAFTAAESLGQLWELAWMIALVLGLLYFTYAIQTWIAIVLSRKSANISSIKGYKRGIFLAPFFMVFYGFATIAGALSRPEWKKVSRNAAYDEAVARSEKPR
ncbi:MAG: glycosyltransferase family 2 protein [Bacilli bacterium]|jgi:cellulose synthase/poly-beta-1,6-N-acetylglucosamine synthase-like glycosyltransferase|nr:glycosyltransferase family 2 protein [Bacilli bacterium]